MDRNESSRKWLMSETYDFKKPVPLARAEAMAKAVLTFCNADGEISEEERDWVLGYASSAGCPDDVLERLSKYSSKDGVEAILKDRPPVPKGRYNTLIYLAIKACSADNYGAKEKKMIRRLAPALDVSKKTISELEALVKKEAALRKKRVKALFPAGKPY